MTEPLGRLCEEYGAVLVSPLGCAWLLTALESARRWGKAVNGSEPRLSAEAEVFARILAIGADGRFAAESTGRSVEVVMPSSALMISTAVASRILGVSPQAVRQRARAGELGAVRHGREWLVSEYETRRAAPGIKAAKRGRTAGTQVDPGSGPGREDGTQLGR